MQIFIMWCFVENKEIIFLAHLNCKISETFIGKLAIFTCQNQNIELLTSSYYIPVILYMKYFYNNV
jgi:hypothetical protein